MSRNITGEILDVVGEIQTEVDAANKEYGGFKHDDEHDGYDWRSLINKHADKAWEHDIGGDRAAFRYQMIRVIGLALSAIAWNERRGRAISTPESTRLSQKGNGHEGHCD